MPSIAEIKTAVDFARPVASTSELSVSGVKINFTGFTPKLRDLYKPEVLENSMASPVILQKAVLIDADKAQKATALGLLLAGHENVSKKSIKFGLPFFYFVDISPFAVQIKPEPYISSLLIPGRLGKTYDLTNNLLPPQGKAKGNNKLIITQNSPTDYSLALEVIKSQKS